MTGGFFEERANIAIARDDMGIHVMDLNLGLAFRLLALGATLRLGYFPVRVRR